MPAQFVTRETAEGRNGKRVESKTERHRGCSKGVVSKTVNFQRFEQDFTMFVTVTIHGPNLTTLRVLRPLPRSSERPLDSSTCPGPLHPTPASDEDKETPGVVQVTDDGRTGRR